ncbi:hypothetical protein HG536_0F00800 [Torulaspora globosa]|uniref:Presequence translocated-associated motor subunit PAM17 n=1 Tax=Torulaspora globosa TaxID=48254 RepID=A0A7G3ZJR9_9SACH|nr:uncharacterized protein HG536_0F00800 [Torulaspora globosa]QLL33755.1 hypothetical protein HG536_0F00800 [Torulaspora globosa]
MLSVAAQFACRRSLMPGLGVNTRSVSLGVRSLSNNADKGIEGNSDLTWIDFFKMRRQQRRINVGSSVFTAFLGCNASWAYLSTMQIDPTQTLLGFDPLMVITAGIAASGALGYLLGPLVGSQIFQMLNRRRLPGFDIKNKEFLKKVIENRVDASSQSFSNPVPDYYGEKIGSIGEYRQWLRDCHAYRRKAKEFL